MKNLLVLFCIVISQTVLAQDIVSKYKDYDWEKNPTLTKTDLDTSNNSIIIFEKKYYEHVYENNALYEYYVTHIREKLITHTGIENSNKIYIQIKDDDVFIIEKARVIKNDGTIRELNKDEIKEAYSDETQKKYHYFAFEGIEEGCEIEYLICVKNVSDLRGTVYNIQTEVPTLSFEAKHIVPINLGLKFKSFNACPEAVLDTAEKEKFVWTIKAENISRIKEEDNATLNANKMKYAVKLNSNTFTGKNDIYSYGPVASSIFDYTYTLDSKEIKSAKNFASSIKLDETTDETKIRSVENFIKTNFIYHKNGDDSKSNITSIITSKSFNETGAIKLFCNVFKNLGIETEIVLTSDRYNIKFDKEYECYPFLENYLIYFPKIKKFLTPTDNFTRLGFPDATNINNYGLFIKTITVGDYNTGLGKIKFISGAKYTESNDILKLKVDINSDFSDTKIEVVRELTGYQAANYQPYFDFINDKDKYKEFTESLIKYIDKEGTIENLVFENNNANFLGQKPLIAKAQLTSDFFFEKAGAKNVFKVGMLIGPQVELYKKEERKLPIDFAYPHSYSRTIEFNIPDGYKISNLDKINISEIYKKNESDASMLFTSNYTQNGNKITIQIEEFYADYEYKISEFEDYRRVANASANFNKVVLIFEKL